MKKVFITVISMLALAACNNNAQQQDTAAADSTAQAQEAPATGGDRDEHGCIPWPDSRGASCAKNVCKSSRSAPA